ncbi:MAG: toxin [Patescibacteria group bacterium]
MKHFVWNKEKNKKLIEGRGVGFADIVKAIERGNVLDIINHKNRKKYPNQKVFIVNINNYAYDVPFVEDEEKIYFKTIMPSRKSTKKYITKAP